MRKLYDAPVIFLLSYDQDVIYMSGGIDATGEWIWEDGDSL